MRLPTREDRSAATFLVHGNINIRTIQSVRRGLLCATLEQLDEFLSGGCR